MHLAPQLLATVDVVWNFEEKKKGYRVFLILCQFLTSVGWNWCPLVPLHSHYFAI
jgi:hypothetical protein